jgi:hypothetical protein
MLAILFEASKMLAILFEASKMLAILFEANKMLEMLFYEQALKLITHLLLFDSKFLPLRRNEYSRKHGTILSRVLQSAFRCARSRSID